MVKVFIKTRAGNTITVDCEEGDTIDMKKLPDKDNEECVIVQGKLHILTSFGYYEASDTEEEAEQKQEQEEEEEDDGQVRIYLFGFWLLECLICRLGLG